MLHHTHTAAGACSAPHWLDAGGLARTSDVVESSQSHLQWMTFLSCQPEGQQPEVLTNAS
jgi:hypothetical protein